MEYDVIIKNCRIIDGTGNPWYKAEIGIKNGFIAALSRTSLNNADRTIDATNLIVCPGFINLHSHSDSTILSHNRAENCLAMGLVTELVGSCGTSSAPLTEDYRETVKERMKNRSWSLMEENVDWLSMGEWFRKVENKGLGINIAPLVGHGTIRNSVMGVEGKGSERISPTEEELDSMKDMLRASMMDGAFGLSTGLIYPPGRNALTNEIVELAKVAAQYGGLYSSHIRCESDRLIDAIRESIDVCESAKVRGVVSHHKAMGWRNFGKVTQTLQLIDEARSKGIDIIIDQYPWRHGGVTKSLGGIFKRIEELAIKNRSELVEKLKDPKEWKNIKRAFFVSREKELNMHEKRRNDLEKKGGWTSTPSSLATSAVILNSKSHPELALKNYCEIAEILRVDDFLEGIRELLIADDGYTVSGNFPYSEDDVVTIMKYPWTTISTDQYAMDNSKINYERAADAIAMQHPRGWGTYPKILGEYVRDRGVLSLEEAIRKMTSLPANFIGLNDRGMIKKGFCADLVLFNPETIRSNATYKNPFQFPEGIQFVLVNGAIAVENGKPTGSLSGRVLRNPSKIM